MKRFFALFLLLSIFLTGCFGESADGNHPNSNIKELDFLRTDDITLKIGKETSGYVNAHVKNSSSFSSEDVLFISENTSVATIEFTHDALTTYLYYKITAVGGGETEVYAKSKDGLVESDHIKVIVPGTSDTGTVDANNVESIELKTEKTDLVIGEIQAVSTTVFPVSIANISLKWSSSDESVAKVDQNGYVTPVGTGSCIVKAIAPNGTEGSLALNVDGTKRLINVKVSRKRADTNNIGDEWTFIDEINGKAVGNTIIFSVGDTLTLHSKYTESDSDPDIGEATTSHTVMDEDFKNGFEIVLDVYVKENRGKNSGQSAHFEVTYIFS